MELILTETIDTLGQEGDIVNVKNGYGRNYLLPQGKAVLATVSAIAQRDRNMAAIQARLDNARGKAEQLAKKLAGATVVVPMRVGEDNRLFGSVTSADLAEKLNDLGIEVDKRKIILDEAIKTIGKVTVAYKAGYQVKAEFMVEVTAIGAENSSSEEVSEEAPEAADVEEELPSEE